MVMNTQDAVVNVIDFLEKVLDEGYIPHDYSEDDVRLLIKSMDMVYDKELEATG